MTFVRWHSASGEQDMYSRLIEQMMGREFPQLASGHVEDTMSSVVSEFISTKQYRLGPRPIPESEVMIRDVVRGYVADNSPIPVLIPFASLKVPFGEAADVAELSALRMLACLQHRVTPHYGRGLQFIIRLEDLTEKVISPDVPDLEHHLTTYQDVLGRLIKVLGYGNFIKLLPESEMASSGDFVDAALDYGLVFERYFLDAENASETELRDLGWKGGVSHALRSFLSGRYSKLYPELPVAQHDSLTARYLGAILARRNLGATGHNGKRLELSFAQPLPDAPAVSTRVIYRTVPLHQTSNHLAPWNAKGHLRIREDGTTRIGLGRFGEEYTPGQLELEGNGSSVAIRADYRLE